MEGSCEGFCLEYSLLRIGPRIGDDIHEACLAIMVEESRREARTFPPAIDLTREG